MEGRALLRDDRHGLTRMITMLRQPSVYWLCFIYAVTFGGFVGFSSFLPIFFHDEYGVGLVTAGSLTALCGLAGSLTRPVGGYAADRTGGLKALLVVFPAIGVLTAVVAAASSRRVGGWSDGDGCRGDGVWKRGCVSGGL